MENGRFAFSVFIAKKNRTHRLLVCGFISSKSGVHRVDALLSILPRTRSQEIGGKYDDTQAG